MLKAGIFLDIENLSRNGGWGIRYDVVKNLVAAQGAVVLRANVYMAIDEDRESREPAQYQKRRDYRDAIRRNGYHMVLKTLRRYVNAEGETVVKANSDLDLAIDALLQADNLDYILLGSGDGDFIRLVRALQNRGKRVDLLSFGNTSTDLRHEVDNHFSGFLVPGVLPGDESQPHRTRGVMISCNVDKGFGFVSVRTGLGLNDVRNDVFMHIVDFSRDGRSVSNEQFANLKARGAVIEFDMVEAGEGRVKAMNAREFRWDDKLNAAAAAAAAANGGTAPTA